MAQGVGHSAWGRGHGETEGPTAGRINEDGEKGGTLEVGLVVVR